MDRNGFKAYSTYSIALRPWYLDVEGGEVAEELRVIGEVRAATGGAHHVCDVLLLQGDGEVLAEAVGAYGALAGDQGLHLQGERRRGKGGSAVSHLHYTNNTTTLITRLGMH